MGDEGSVAVVPHPSSQPAVPHRNAERKHAPDSRDGVDVDVSAQELSEAARVVEPEPRPAMSPSEAGIELGERMEQPVPVHLVDADARIAHLDANLSVAL